jgi:hypothetical protein
MKSGNLVNWQAALQKVTDWTIRNDAVVTTISEHGNRT